MLRPLLIVPLALLMHQSALGQSDFNFNAYKPATIQEILDEHSGHISEALEDASKTVFEAGIFRYRLLSTYLGGKRRMRFAIRMRINAWSRSLGISENIADLYTHEIQIEEGGRKRWIPALGQVMPFLEKKLVREDPIHLYLVFIGVFRKQPVFLINDFRKAPLD